MVKINVKRVLTFAVLALTLNSAYSMNLVEKKKQEILERKREQLLSTNVQNVSLETQNAIVKVQTLRNISDALANPVGLATALQKLSEDPQIALLCQQCPTLNFILEEGIPGTLATNELEEETEQILEAIVNLKEQYETTSEIRQDRSAENNISLEIEFKALNAALEFETNSTR